MSLQLVEWTTNWPLVLPYFDGTVPAGFPSRAEDYLETPLDLHDFLIDNNSPQQKQKNQPYGAKIWALLH